MTKWMNAESAPESLSKGYDMLVGQNAAPGENRMRSATVPLADPAVTCPVKNMTDFIIPTGGGYFFTPSITVLKRMASHH